MNCIVQRRSATPRLTVSRWIGAAITLLAVAMSVPPLRSLIEHSMFWHMVVQMPLLVLGGGLLHGRPRRTQPGARGAGDGGDAGGSDWNRYGLTGFIASQMIAAYWMLPLAIDRAVILPAADALKIVSLLVCGALLQAAVARSTAVVELFFVGSAVSMAVFAGTAIASAEQRLCTVYALQDQLAAGIGMAALALLLAAVWGYWRLRQDHG